jgi:hypothetical protein
MPEPRVFTTFATRCDRALARVLDALVRAYQYVLSPWVGNSCRYWPTCSEYARESLARYGSARGSYLAACRLARCHPYGRGGVDPVPATFAWRCRCHHQGDAQDSVT